MEQTTEKIIGTAEKAVREYQCSGCIDGPFKDCYKTEQDYGVGCRGHVAGTIISYVGKIFLGMPKAFNRLGHWERMKVEIYDGYIDDVIFDKFNMPVWKHLDKHGNTLVRGLRPRINEPFITVILGNHLDKIDCLEISQEEIDIMD